MIRNFLIITLRSLATHKVYTFINILGLAVGMACALLISIFILHEISYDNFHRDADRIYRVYLDGSLRGQPLKVAVTSAPMAGALKEEFPAVESSLRIAKFGAWLVSYNEIRFNEDNLLFTDSNFFNFFSFQLIKGDPDSALVNPRSLVLTRSTAIKYFGHEDVLGEELRIETFDEPFIVTGLMEDVQSNSHFHFDILSSLVTLNKYLRPVWVSHNVYTYIKTIPGTKISSLEPEINGLVDKYVIPEVEKYLDISVDNFRDGTNRIQYKLQPLRKIHLNSNLDVELETNGRGLYVYAFGIIAFLIIFIACLNFINLSTASSSNRAKEVVLRKIMGSERKMLIFQFLTESVLFSFFSLILALLMTEIAMPYFNKFLSIDLRFTILGNFSAVCTIILLTLILGLLAGSYPAFFISSYEPVKVLHGILKKGIKNRKVRAVFVVVQFFISILIIIMTIVVIAQVEFMLNKELGFEKERILVIRRSDALKDRINDFKAEILQNPNIESVTNSNSIPGRDFLASSYMVEIDSVRKNLFMNQIFVSHGFMEVFGLSLLNGRFFSDTISSDTMACVINETAAHEIRAGNVVGTVIEAPAIKGKSDRLKIVGVVKDFHFESVDKPIEPLVISLMPGNWEGYLNVKLSSQGVDKSIKFLEETWEKYTSEYPFLYFFLQKDFDQNYRSVIRTSRVLLFFAILSVFVALLGLFGLIIYTTNQRTQEIGIRKALGATYYQIIMLLIKETVLLILYASIAAWIVAYLFSQIWLKEFNSRISLSPKYFLFSSGIVLVLALLVVLYQCYLASKSNPSEALKAE